MKKRSQKVFLEDIFSSINKIERYTFGMELKEFEENEILIDAVIRNLEIIGEASKNISNEIRQKYSQIPWQKIVGFRNIAIHEYFWLDLPIIWNIIRNNLSDIKNLIAIMINDPNID